MAKGNKIEDLMATMGTLDLVIRILIGKPPVPRHLAGKLRG